MTELLDSIEFWHWWVLAALLIAIEVFVPTTVFLWTGISAATAGLIVLVVEGIGWQNQILLFAILSVVSVIAWRGYARLRPTLSEGPLLNRRAEQCVGRVVVLEVPIVNGEGTINVEGTIWKVAGDDLVIGDRVKVVAADVAILKVEKA